MYNLIGKLSYISKFPILLCSFLLYYGIYIILYLFIALII